MKERIKRCVHKKRFPTFSKWLCSWWHSPLSCFHFWARWLMRGACGRYHKHRKSLPQNIPFPITSLIFMWIIAGL
ncbi:hypothetical protein BM535_12865, partial [Clostridioides difficile]